MNEIYSFFETSLLDKKCLFEFHKQVLNKNNQRFTSGVSTFIDSWENINQLFFVKIC